MSNWVRPIVAATRAVRPPITAMKASAGRRVFEQRRHPRGQEHAGGHHGRSVDQRGNRRRAFHRVRQPGVQAELRRLAHGADEEKNPHGRQRVHLEAEEAEGGVRQLRHPLEDLVEAHRGRTGRGFAAMPSTKPKSPTRLTRNALDRRADWPTASRTRSRSGGRRRGPPPPSRKNSWTRLSAVTSISIMKVNRLR